MQNMEAAYRGTVAGNSCGNKKNKWVAMGKEEELSGKHVDLSVPPVCTHGWTPAP